MIRSSMNVKIEVLKESELQGDIRYSGLVRDLYYLSKVYILSDEELNMEPDEKTFEDMFFEDYEVDNTYYLNYPQKKYKFEYRVPGFFRYNESLGFDEESKAAIELKIKELE